MEVSTLVAFDSFPDIYSWTRHGIVDIEVSLIWRVQIERFHYIALQCIVLLQLACCTKL